MRTEPLPARLEAGVSGLFDAGIDPVGIAIDRTGQHIHVTARGSDELLTFRTDDSALVSRLRVGSRPNCICLLPDCGRACVGNAGSDDVSVIDLAAGRVIATIPVGEFPAGIIALPDGSRVYVTDYHGASVTAIDLAAGRVIATIPVLPYPWGIAAAAEGDRLFVAGANLDRLDIIDVKAGRVEGAIPVHRAPEGLALMPDKEHLCVACRTTTAGSIDLVNITEARIVKRIPITGYPVTAAPILGGSHVIYSCHVGGEIGIIEAREWNIVWRSLGFRGPCYTAQSPDGSRTWVCCNVAGKIAVVSHTLA